MQVSVDWSGAAKERDRVTLPQRDDSYLLLEAEGRTESPLVFIVACFLVILRLSCYTDSHLRLFSVFILSLVICLQVLAHPV